MCRIVHLYLFLPYLFAFTSILIFITMPFKVLTWDEVTITSRPPKMKNIFLVS